MAKVIPAGPAPMTAIFLLFETLLKTNDVSAQALGLTKQPAGFPSKTWSRQAWLQAIQVLISSTLPCFAFRGQAGSAKKGEP
jgi:hypothetical protein